VVLSDEGREAGLTEDYPSVERCILTGRVDEDLGETRVVGTVTSSMYIPETSLFLDAEDAALIVATRNALPKLLDEIERQAAEIERMRNRSGRSTGIRNYLVSAR
jgi:hypothetical protein